MLRKSNIQSLRNVQCIHLLFFYLLKINATNRCYLLIDDGKKNVSNSWESIKHKRNYTILISFKKNSLKQSLIIEKYSTATKKMSSMNNTLEIENYIFCFILHSFKL